MKASSKKLAIIISYIYLIVNTISQIILTPFYLDKLGVDEYGLYQMIYSVAQYILIIDCGISTTMIRYISEFRAQHDKEKEQGFGFLIFVFVIVVVSIVLVAGLFIRANLSSIYSTLTASELKLSQSIFIAMIIQIMMTIASHYLEGVIVAYERYTFSKTLNLCKIILTLVLNYVFILSGMGIYGIVVANTAAIVCVFLVELFYVVFVLKFKIKFYGFPKEVIISAASLMLALLLQSIIGHVNATIDKTILGIYSTKESVAIYSVANTFVTFFNTVPSVISSVFLPSAVKLVVAKADNEALTDFVIKPGRIQFISVAFIFVEFLIVGKSFIARWAGADLATAWTIALIIMVPNSIPLIQNVCLSILNAQNKRLARSIILVMISVINVFVSVFLIKRFGLMGAPVGTSISYILGHCIAMNIYYKKVIGLNVPRMFNEIFKGTLLCSIITVVVCLPLRFVDLGCGYIEIFAKALLIAAVYGILIFKLSLNSDERTVVNNILKKLSFKRIA